VPAGATKTYLPDFHAAITRIFFPCPEMFNSLIINYVPSYRLHKTSSCGKWKNLRFFHEGGKEEETPCVLPS
jgi:hypothetical protein